MNPDPLELEIARHRPQPVSQSLRARIERDLSRPATEPRRTTRAARLWWLFGSVAAAALVFAVRVWSPPDAPDPIEASVVVEPKGCDPIPVEPTPVPRTAPTGPTLWACRQAAARSDADLDSLLATHSPRVFANASAAPRVGVRDLEN